MYTKIMNYAAAVMHFSKFNPKRANLVFSYFNEPKEVWNAELDELVNAGLEETIADEFIAWREKFSLDKMSDELENENIKTVNIRDVAYPFLLRQISDPPAVLFYRGVLPEFEDHSVSVVGTRRCTAYGKYVTNKISGDLAANGVIVVSGLALGIDAEAHLAALENKGITIAVLGTGIDKSAVHPRTNFQLSERIIAEGGAIVSEYPPKFEATQYSFPARNRIIAGLTMGTLITEAPTSSGALITANYCLDYNREVFAVPHPINSLQGAGCNLFIKKGAQLVTGYEEIMEALQIEQVKKQTEKTKIQSGNMNEEKILAILCKNQANINELIKETGLPSQTVTGTLTILEMRGKIRNMGGMVYTMR